MPVYCLALKKTKYFQASLSNFLHNICMIMKLTSNQMLGTLPFLFTQGASMCNSSYPSDLPHFSAHSHLEVKKGQGGFCKSRWFYTVLVNRSMKLQRDCWQNWSGEGRREERGKARQMIKKKKTPKNSKHFPKENSSCPPTLKPPLGPFSRQTLPGGALPSGNIPWHPLQEANSRSKGATADSSNFFTPRLST